MISHKTFMNIAKEIAKESKARKRKVGAIIVKDNSIISVGYNGTPHGFDNNCEYEEEVMARSYKVEKKLITKPEVLHAESNAITKCAKSTASSEGASIFTTTMPCLECSKLIVQSGITEVIYSENYSNSKGLELLFEAGIKVVKLK